MYQKLKDDSIPFLRYNGYKFLINTSSFWSVYEVCFGKLYDPLFNRLRENDVLLDAGANIGAFTVLAADKVSKIYAVEPDPASFRLLLNNIAENDLNNVIPLNIAISDTNGISYLTGQGIGAHLAPTGKEVKTDTIDSICRDITAIKMDIEGSEIRALNGSKALLQYVHSIIIETHETFREVADILSSNNFSVQELDLGPAKWINKKTFSQDMLLNEFQTRFSLTKQLYAFLMSKSTRNSPRSKLLFAYKRNGAHSSRTR